MAKSIIPSTALLSTFSRALRADQPQCLRMRLPSAATARAFSSSSPRAFNGSASRGYKTVEEARSRYKSGPFSWKGGVLFIGAGAGLVFYFRYEKARMERKRVAEAAKGVGKPKVGGEFELVDQRGRRFSSEDLKGKYSLVSVILWEWRGGRREKGRG